MTWQRAIAIVFFAILVVTPVWVPAGAAVVLEFSPTSAAVGERVSGESDESGTILPGSADLEIFLAPSQRAADNARGPRDPRLTFFGNLRVDEQGVGRFTGTVPDVVPGDHVAVGYCGGCSPASTFTVGEFSVSGATLPTTGSPSGGRVWFAVLSIATGVLALVLVRRHSSA